MNKKIIAGFAVVLSALTISVSSNFQIAEAARCAQSSFQAEFKNADSVFVGKVTGDTTEGDKRIIEFTVEKYWKGSNAKLVTITVYESARFQSPFESGNRYLVYANSGDDGLTVSRCSRSRAVKYATDDLKKLGTGKAPRR